MNPANLFCYNKLPIIVSSFTVIKTLCFCFINILSELLKGNDINLIIKLILDGIMLKFVYYNQIWVVNFWVLIEFCQLLPWDFVTFEK